KDLEKKDKDLRLYANAKEEIAKLQNQVARADAARLEAERARDAVQAKAAALAKERDEMRAAYENRLRNNPDRIALVVEAISRLRTLEFPRETKLANRLVPRDAAKAGAYSYARAILADYNGDPERFRRELQQAAQEKNDPWSRLAQAEPR